MVTLATIRHFWILSVHILMLIMFIYLINTLLSTINWNIFWSFSVFATLVECVCVWNLTRSRSRSEQQNLASQLCKMMQKLYNRILFALFFHVISKSMDFVWNAFGFSVSCVLKQCECCIRCVAFFFIDIFPRALFSKGLLIKPLEPLLSRYYLTRFDLTGDLAGAQAYCM